MVRYNTPFPNDLVASTNAQRKLLNYIPADELKRIIIDVIEKEGLTFAEQEFIHLIFDCWNKKTITKHST